MSDDGNFSAVPPMLAQLADVPHTTAAVKVEKQNGKLTVDREIEGGAHEVVELPSPCLISVQTGMNQVRYASLKGIMAAKKKKIETRDAAALGVDAASLAPQTRLVAMELPPPRPEVRMIEGDPAEQSRELLRLLREEAKIL